MTRTNFSGVVRKGGGRTLVLGAVVSAALALCLLALLAAQPAGAAFPGNNGKIVFWSSRAGSPGLYVIAPGGAASKVPGTSAGDNDAAWSPDGTKIAFRSASASNYEISVMNADGTGRRQLTTTPVAEQEPTWSPDSSKIAYVLGGEIWVMNANGSDPLQITDNTFPDTAPAWSPDGSKIAFVSARDGDSDRNIYVMNADGSGPASNLTPFTPGPQPGDPPYQGHDDDPAWSPDGTKIAYVHTFASNASGVPNIWVMDANGGNKANVQADSSTSGVYPAWSPDGSKIAFVGATDTNRDIWTMDANGANPARIETGGNAAHDINPDWQPIVPSLRIGDDRVKEKTTTARFVVRLSPASQQSVTVNYATANGKAKAPADYATRRGALTFAPGETSKTVAVPIKSDRKNEPNETFSVKLSGANTPIADASGRGTIVDND